MNNIVDKNMLTNDEKGEIMNNKTEVNEQQAEVNEQQANEKKRISKSIANHQKKDVPQRRQRTPLLQQRSLMRVPKDPYYEYRIANDVGDNISNLIEAGYEIVDRDNNTIEIDLRAQDPLWRQRAKSQSVGGGMIAYLMRIPKEWYKEDQRKKFKMVDDSEKGLSVVPKSKDNQSHDTSFSGEIKISHE